MAVLSLWGAGQIINHAWNELRTGEGKSSRPSRRNRHDLAIPVVRCGRGAGGLDGRTQGTRGGQSLKSKALDRVKECACRPDWAGRSKSEQQPPSFARLGLQQNPLKIPGHVLAHRVVSQFQHLCATPLGGTTQGKDAEIFSGSIQEFCTGNSGEPFMPLRPKHSPNQRQRSAHLEDNAGLVRWPSAWRAQ